jgi:hypothetical protein
MKGSLTYKYEYLKWALKLSSKYRRIDSCVVEQKFNLSAEVPFGLVPQPRPILGYGHVALDETNAETKTNILSRKQKYDFHPEKHQIC